jgi:fructokinase
VLSTAVETLASSAPDVEVVDTVGAGDAFSAAVIVGLLEGWDSARILHRGLRLAAAVCRIPGAIPSNSTFYRRIAREWA